MADIQANIGIGVDTTQALAAIRRLQREISVFHSLMAKGGANAAAESMRMQQSLINTINETGKFSAGMARISSSTESFTNALEKNKLSMTQYFRYAGGASKTFGKMFSREFNTINRVATERVKDLQTQYISMGRDANGALQAIKVRPLALDMDNLGTKVMLASQKQQIFNQLLKQGTTNLLNFGKNTQWAGRQLMVGFTIPLTIFGATAAREFQKLEEQAVKFRRVYGDMFTTDADTEKALANVRELADEFTKYGIAIEKTIGLAAKVAQMGNVGDDLTAQVTQATRLAVLGGMEQEEALDTTISLTNAFGIAAEDLAGKIAFLNAAENQTILAIEDFNEAIPKAGSVVQQLGGDVEDLAFFLTAMREGGINASQAANALKSSLGRLINPTEVAKKELAAFGIDIVSIVENNAGNLRNMVMQLGYALDGLDPLNRARAIEQLFGKFQFARMSTMFQNIVKDGSQANKVLQLTTNSTEELAIIAERELKRVEDSVSFKFQKQLEKLQAALAPIGEEFLKAVTPLVEFGTKLLKSFNELGDGGKQFIVVLTAIAGVVAPAALMAFGLVANGVANLIKFFALLARGFGSLSGQSTLLGGQTEYMTQQQIEAAAVAASLGQSHSNLTQIFTTETSAIGALAAAYRNATIEQRQFAAGRAAAGIANTTSGPRVKGFAKGGIIRGPGTGTSDSIFARISNGEAIIPAEQVKKYRGVVEQLIADNVPGFAGGLMGGPGTYRKTSSTAMYGPGNQSAAGIDLSWLASGGPDVAASVGGVYKSGQLIESGQRVSQSNLESLSNLNPLINELTSVLQGQVLPGVQSFADLSQRAFPELIATIDRLEAQGSVTADEAERARTTTRKMFAPTESDLTETRIPRYDVREDESGYYVHRKASEKVGFTAKGQIKAATQFERQRMGLEPMTTMGEGSYQFAHGTEALTYQGNDPLKLGRETTPGSIALKEQIEQGKEFKEKARIELKDAGTSAAEGLVEGVEQTLQIASPSKRMFGLGQNAADSLADGFEQGMADEKGTVGKKPLPGKLAAPLPPVPPTEAAKTFDKGMKGVFQKVGDGMKKNAKALGEKMLNPLGVAIGKAAGNTITDNDGNVLYDADAAQARQNLGLGEPTSLPDMEPLATDRKGNVIIGPNGQPYTVSQYKEVKKESRRQARQNRSGKALGALGTLSMVTGMATQIDGQIGQMAQKLFPFIGAMTAIVPLLLAMNPLLAAVVAGFGFLGYSIYQNIKAQEDMRKESKQLAQTFSAGTDAVEKFAEFAGTATASQIQERRRASQGQVFQFEPGRTTFGQSFVESETGQDFVKQIELGITRLGRTGAISRLTNQLSSAVIAGAIDFEQAKSIASNIGAALEDRSFSISVTGELINLFGPDGSNLLEDPLALGMALQQRLVEQNARTMADLRAPEISAQDLSERAYQLASEEELSFFDQARTFLGTSEEQIFRERAGSKKYRDLAQQSLETEAQEFAAQDLEDLLQFNQDTLDSITTNYQDALATAREAGDTKKMSELTEQYNQTREDFAKASEEAFNVAISQFSDLELADQTAMIKSGRETILSGIEDEQIKSQTERSLSRLGSMEGVTNQIEYEIVTLLRSDTITPEVFNKLVADPNIDFTAVAEIGAKYGPNAGQIINQILSLEDETVKAQVSAQFAAEDTTVAGGLSLFDMLNNAASIGLLFPDKVGLLVEFFAQNQDAAAVVDENIKEIQGMVDAEEPITMDVVQRVFAESPEVVEAVLANQEEFEKMAPQDQVEFLQSINILYNVQATGEPWLLEILRNEGGIGPDAELTPEITQDIIVDLGRRFTQTMTPDLTTNQNTDPDPDPKAGAEPQIDSLIKKLRDLRMASIDMQKGWEGMQRVLQSVFAGGTQEINVFDGLSNQIRSLGVGENLIEMIVGMDPDEYEKRKGELFEFDKDGRIIKATAALKNLSAAFGAVALGEYVNSQQAFIANTRNQISAINTLTANGLSLAEAYQVVQDEAVAARIAMGATTEEIKELVRITQLANDLREQLEEQNERSQISEAVRKTNEEFENRVAVLDRLSKSAGQYTDAQITALLNDTNLQKLMLDPSIDQGAFNQALRNAERNAEIELRVKLATTEGTKGVFEEGLAAAMDAFSRQEQEIELNFKATTADDQALIDDAQNRIAAIQYELDDYNAELERISWQEEDINEKYDKRFEALESIAEVNERISREQQAQLDIADALSRGDIAAAARAQQALVSQQAQDATQQQRKMLEQARDAEIQSLTGASGLTREQLEDRIQGLERQIFAIEESDLEPAQERVRLQEVLKQQQIDSLMVLEMTRDEWDRIKNNIDLAEASGYQFKETMQQALDVVEKLMTAYPEVKPAPPPPPPAPAPSSGGGGGVDLGQPGKGAWKIGNQTLSDIAKSAGFGSWQAYYNANRGSQNLDAKLRPAASGGLMKLAMGGKVKRYAGGGMIIPKRMAMGGYSMGSDTIPAILTPGEFVVRRPAVSAFGVDNLEKINRGTYNDGSVYNYNLAVNVKSDSDPNRIARVVMGEIRGIENQRIRSNRL